MVDGPAKPVPVCGTRTTGPASPPSGAVVVRPGTRLDRLVAAEPARTTFWLAPGVHTLGSGRYSQVLPKDGDAFVGAPGSVLDGRQVNQYAFGGQAADVRIEALTVRSFGRPLSNRDEGVVNHDSAPGWRITGNRINLNAGAAVMLGDRNVLSGNCLRDNGQYAFNAYRQGDGITDLVVTGNEITGNNTADWERRVDGCGCTGGGKFWAVTGATVRGNYVHDNAGVGLWADTNNTGFEITGNYVADNDAEGIFYEISYNARIVGNTLVRNGLVKGPTNPGFPTAAIYLSESGGDQRAGSRYAGTLEVSGNTLVDNWSGVVAWENADRFAGSPANTSSGYTTRVDPAATFAACADASRGRSKPLYDDCRWKTQHVDVHDNVFRLDADRVKGCTPSAGCGYMGLFSNYGTYPSWSPYRGDVVMKAIVGSQDNHWRANTYEGPWRFMVGDQGSTFGWGAWRSTYGQDPESTLG